MPESLEDLALFIRTRLVPCAIKNLKMAFLAHCNEGIDVETKDDGTPASRADKETEQLLRAVIGKTFPSHGIVGEEFGITNPGAEFVWVLDPLDGTKEFLARETGWGTLIALLHCGKPILGTIIDPLQDRLWDQDTPPSPRAASRPLEQITVATTNPKNMFTGTAYEQGASALYARCQTLQERWNCLGFAHVAEGTIDLALENKLKLHDVAALFPVLMASGAVCRTLNGANYKDMVFDPADCKARFGLMTGHDEKLVDEALDILNGATP